MIDWFSSPVAAILGGSVTRKEWVYGLGILIEVGKALSVVLPTLLGGSIYSRNNETKDTVSHCNGYQILETQVFEICTVSIKRDQIQ